MRSAAAFGQARELERSPDLALEIGRLEAHEGAVQAQEAPQAHARRQPQPLG